MAFLCQGTIADMLSRVHIPVLMPGSLLRLCLLTRSAMLIGMAGLTSLHCIIETLSMQVRNNTQCYLDTCACKCHADCMVLPAFQEVMTCNTAINTADHK